MNVTRIIFIVIGRFRLLFGFCPLCDSSAPKLYDCPVCEYNYAPKMYWWDRFRSYLRGDGLPTFRNRKG